MQHLPLKVAKSLEKRKREQAFRQLSTATNLVDFSSNDYLGLAKSVGITEKTYQESWGKSLKSGAGGSRLLTGNHPFYKPAEDFLSGFHESEAALIFNSGYDANLGLLSSVARRGDVVLFDELAHASLRDGISLSLAKAFKFKHNDIDDLKRLLGKMALNADAIFVVTESVFSMDGDSPDLVALVALCEQYSCFLIVDEAHATGVFGAKGEGLVQQLGVQDKVFARIITFGKALGVHGAAVLGSCDLRDYLINFARSLIYTTALSPHTVAAILAAYKYLDSQKGEFVRLRRNIDLFKAEIRKRSLQTWFHKSNSAIQVCVIPGNEQVKKLTTILADEGYDVKAILSPTVPAGQERLRFCVHAFNSREEIAGVLELLALHLK